MYEIPAVPRFPSHRTNWERKFAPFATKMRSEREPEQAIQMFRHYFSQLATGASGYVSGTVANPVSELPSSEHLDSYRAIGTEALASAIAIKLNGGLGTTMGMRGPKSLLEAKQGLTFLDIICHQVLHARQAHDIRLPLILMNSYNTHDESIRALAAYPEILNQGIAAGFIQHKIPRIWKDDLTVVTWPADRHQEWCPPGHGDLYLALHTTGLLKSLLEKGYEYAFISNADNLGATIEPSILGYCVASNIPFLMEVARREQSDSKGGHLALHPRQGLTLRELAQCPPQELAEFRDIERYKYFNTNNLWLHLPSLERLLSAEDGLLRLPLIRNEKPIDPTRRDSPHVYQLETAAGHAINIFQDAQALEVPRSRFHPTKTTNDLVALWSDAYVLRPDFTVALNPKREIETAPVVRLDRHYYSHIDQINERFIHGIPSLLNCRRFQVDGNIYFGPIDGLLGDVTLRSHGDVPTYLAGHLRKHLLHQ